VTLKVQTRDANALISRKLLDLETRSKRPPTVNGLGHVTPKLLWGTTVTAILATAWLLVFNIKCFFCSLIVLTCLLDFLILFQKFFSLSHSTV